MKAVSSVLMVLVALLGMATSTSAATITVHVFNLDFSENPSGQPIVDPTIDLGDTVHWVWDSGFHSTTSVAGLIESWDSGAHSPSFSFDHTFSDLGVFPYYCQIHGFDNGNGTAGGMSGTITVIPEPSSLILVILGALGVAGGWWWRKTRAS
jgi:plastocyanin